MPSGFDEATEKAAIMTALRFLDVAVKKITIPLFGMVFLAVMTCLLKVMPNFVGFLLGQTGALKSTMAQLALGFFGDFATLAKLANFNDTANSVEKRASILKDALMLIDDLHPGQSRREMQQRDELCQRIVRSVSNRTGRGRLNSDSSEKVRNEPRGGVIFTGEELVSGTSTRARCMIIPVEPGAVDTERLSELQARAYELPTALASFILWLSPRVEEIQKTFSTRFFELRLKASGQGQHRKTPEQTAFIVFTYEIITRWMMDKNVITADAATGMIDDAWGVMTELQKVQAEHIISEDPIRRFSDVLTALISTGEVAIKSLDLDTSTSLGDDKNADVIGFIKDGLLNLEATLTWHKIREFCQREGSHFATSHTAFYEIAKNRGLLVSRGNENTLIFSACGRKFRAMRLNPKILNLGDENE